jgi:hypothetical protein
LFNNAQLVFEHLFERDITVKGSLGSDFSASLLVRFPCILFKDIAKTSFGVHGSDLAASKRSFKYGAQLEFNV